VKSFRVLREPDEAWIAAKNATKSHRNSDYGGLFETTLSTRQRPQWTGRQGPV